MRLRKISGQVLSTVRVLKTSIQTEHLYSNPNYSSLQLHPISAGELLVIITDVKLQNTTGYQFIHKVHCFTCKTHHWRVIQIRSPPIHVVQSVATI
jgi:hypothetical protein